MTETDETEPERDEPAIIAERRAKLARLRESGVDPFPHEFQDRVDISSVRAEHDGLEDGEETDSEYRVAGRIAANRDMGKVAFLDLVDRTGKIQLQSRRRRPGRRARRPDRAWTWATSSASRAPRSRAARAS